jgi:signal transduction histidine kinase
MAVNFRQRHQETGQLTRIRAALSDGKRLWREIVHRQPVSTEYRQWRDRLIQRRFWLAIALAVTYVSIAAIAGFYEIFIHPEPLLKGLERNQLGGLIETIQKVFVLHKITFIILLGGLISLWNSSWGRKHPAIMLVLLPWAIAFIPEMVLGAFSGIPRGPSTTMFMAQAVIAPTYWQLHLLAQLVPIAFYFLIYPLIGLGSFGGFSIYSFSNTGDIILVCFICEIGVYLYEQSKQSELKANRQLKLCIHSITHDLRTPVMGSLMLLESIRQSSLRDQPIKMSQIEMTRLIQGSNRLLGLMDSLLIPQAFSQDSFMLHRQPTNLSTIVTPILKDFHPALTKQAIQIDNRIPETLPLVDIDIQQIRRVFNNLIDNAISHNPPGIVLTLEAIPLTLPSLKGSHSLLKVIIQDNGVGIFSSQQETIFEPYTRGQKTQYLPGLGLGLYICRQVILAHQGSIGVERLEPGTAFWFTLALSKG